jgi:hypothetical protein
MGKLTKLGLVIGGIVAVAALKSRLGREPPEPITPIEETDEPASEESA